MVALLHRSRNFLQCDRPDGHPFDKNKLGLPVVPRRADVLEAFARDRIKYVLKAVASRSAENLVFSASSRPVEDERCRLYW
jgi:hypothetical protein